MHKIVPQTIKKSVSVKGRRIKDTKYMAKSDIEKKVVELEAKMKKAAEELRFEEAIELRDVIEGLKEEL